MLSVKDLTPAMVDDLYNQYQGMLTPVSDLQTAEDPSFDAVRQQMYEQNLAMQNNGVPSNAMVAGDMPETMIPQGGMLNAPQPVGPMDFIGALGQGIVAKDGETPFGDFVGNNWQNLLSSGVSMMQDAYMRDNLPAETYIKLKAQENDKIIAEQDRLLRNLQMQADNDYQRQSIDLKREELALERQRVLSGGDSPAAIKQAKWYQEATPAEREIYDRVNKIGLDTVDLGDRVVFVDKVTGGAVGEMNKELSPEAEPKTKEDQAAATARGQELGAAESKLSSIEASMPTLENVAQRLSKLGKIATYTTAGQVRDTAMRELGMDIPDAAVARTEYISTVDNEVLPLLRQTFGAQFTENEGNRLRVTLGDPDKTPEEKDAVLRSFITAKKGEIESLRRQTGKEVVKPAQPAQPTVTRLKFNPVTGDFE